MMQSPAGGGGAPAANNVAATPSHTRGQGYFPCVVRASSELIMLPPAALASATAAPAWSPFDDAASMVMELFRGLAPEDAISVHSLEFPDRLFIQR